MLRNWKKLFCHAEDNCPDCPIRREYFKLKMRMAMEKWDPERREKLITFLRAENDSLQKQLDQLQDGRDSSK